MARESRPDTDRSTTGRLAAETVVWLPQARTPAMGATRAVVNDAHATVTLPGDHTIDVTATVDAEGRLRDVQVQRRGTPHRAEFGVYPFGGDVDAETTLDGVTLPSHGRVGWSGTDRQHDGVRSRCRMPHADSGARGSSHPGPPRNRR